MPVSVCPHCKTQLWVKDTQLNVAQGFVMCRQCEGLFQAKNHIAPTPDNLKPEQLPQAITDAKLVHSVGPQVRAKKALSKHEIADLLDNLTTPTAPQPTSVAAAKRPFNWALACIVAFIVLIMQLAYLILLR